MVRNVNGFKLEVNEKNGLPHVRVSLSDGTVIVDTDRVSIKGLQNMVAVFEVAADIADQELDHKYAKAMAVKGAN